MWVHFIRIAKVFQKLFPVGIRYDEETRKFQPNEKRSWLYIIANANIIQANAVALCEVVDYMGRDSSQNPKSFPNFIIDILFWGLSLLCPAYVWTMWKKKSNFAWFLNQTFLHRKIRDEKIGPEELLIYSAVGCGLLVPPCLAPLPLRFDNTAIHTVLRFYLPQSLMENPLFEQIICGIYISIIGCIGCITPIFIIICVMVLVMESKFFLQPVYHPDNIYHRTRFESSAKERPASVNHAVKLYRITFLIWRAFLDFGCVYFPTLMFNGYVINVITTYSVIKMRNSLPPALVVMLALFDISTFVLTIGVHKYALVIVEEVDKFLTYWKTEMLSRRERACLRSCLPIRAKIGPFFCLEPTTILDTFMQVIDMTVTLLLS